MNRKKICMGIAALFCIFAFCGAAVSAAVPAAASAKTPGGMTVRLDRLEEQGYDVSSIRAALESGDVDTAHDLLHQFMEEHRDELPAPHAGSGKCIAA